MHLNVYHYAPCPCFRFFFNCFPRKPFPRVSQPRPCASCFIRHHLDLFIEYIYRPLVFSTSTRDYRYTSSEFIKGLYISVYFLRNTEVLLVIFTALKSMCNIKWRFRDRDGPFTTQGLRKILHGNFAYFIPTASSNTSPWYTHSSLMNNSNLSYPIGLSHTIHGSAYIQ